MELRVAVSSLGKVIAQAALVMLVLPFDVGTSGLNGVLHDMNRIDQFGNG